MSLYTQWINLIGYKRQQHANSEWYIALKFHTTVKVHDIVWIKVKTIKRDRKCLESSKGEEISGMNMKCMKERKYKSS